MIRVAVGIITKSGSPGIRLVLLCQRKKSSRYGLKWEFPGGKIETGESVTEALRRELREELDIEAVVGELYHRQNYVYPDSGTFDVHYHTVSEYTGALTNRVFESIEWVPLSRLAEYDILEGNGEVARKLIAGHA